MQAGSSWQVYDALTQRVDRDEAVSSSKLEVNLIFTNAAATRVSLNAACLLARDLDARITILMAQVVPYPLPLTEPPVPVQFTQRELLRIAHQQAVETELDTRIRICLCRDRRETIREGLRPESLVVIGGRRHWWPTAEKSLASALRRDGHRVFLVDTGATR